MFNKEFATTNSRWCFRLKIPNNLSPANEEKEVFPDNTGRGARVKTIPGSKNWPKKEILIQKYTRKSFEVNTSRLQWRTFRDDDIFREGGWSLPGPGTPCARLAYYYEKLFRAQPLKMPGYPSLCPKRHARVLPKALGPGTWSCPAGPCGYAGLSGLGDFGPSLRDHWRH